MALGRFQAFKRVGEDGAEPPRMAVFSWCVVRIPL